MRYAAYQRGFRIASYIVLILMAVAIIFATVMGIVHWSGIGV